MTKTEAKISCDRANEIENWIKEEYPDIQVVHLRDCGTKLFYFKDPTSEYRCIGMIQIPINVIHDGVNPQTGYMHCTFAYEKVIFNAIDEEYDMEDFYEMFKRDKKFIKNYLEKSVKENLAGIIKSQQPVYSLDDAINDMVKELHEEVDRETIKKIIEEYAIKEAVRKAFE